MALQDVDGKYYKVGKIVGFNSVNNSLTVTIEAYKDANTRNNMTQYDTKILTTEGVQMDNVDCAAFVTKVYEKLKLSEPYSDMTDV